MDTNRYSDYAQAGLGTEHGTVADLSAYADALLNNEDIAARLDDEQERRLVSYIKAATDMSYRKISKRYDSWKEADRAHDVYVPPEATEFREKAVIADTRAIADTVITYMMAALTGRNPMFQLEGLNRNSRRGALLMERVFHQQMRRTAGEARIAQMQLDSLRYGFAPTKVIWDAARNTNQIINTDPRCTFPDPRVQWGDWDNMQFIVFTDHVSYPALVQSGLYPKLRAFPQLRNRLSASTNGWDAHTWHKEQGKGLSIDPTTIDVRSDGGTYFTLGSNRVVDECWLKLAGYEIGLPQLDQVWMVVTILDERVVLRCQLNPYGQQFPVNIGSLYQDCHKTYGQSLYDVIMPLHDIATWLLRSRVDNVQAALTNLVFADPTRVSVPDLMDRNPWGIVRTLAGSDPGDGVFIAQVPDVTRGHWDDIAALSDMKQRVSAASDAQQGMPTAGIRSATEIQRLSQLGSQRLGVLARLSSATCIRPMVRMCVANIQDSLTNSGSVRIEEEHMPPQLAGLVEDGYLDYDVTKDLQGDIDYLVIDGTLPLEPTRNAETWLNILQLVGQADLQMEYNRGQMVEEAIRAMGVTDMDRFRIPRDQQGQNLTPSQQLSIMEKQRGQSVQPQEQLMRNVEKGNLIPLNEARKNAS